MQIKPLNDYVLIKPLKKEGGLLVVPELDKTLTKEDGEVLAVGPGRITGRGAIVPMSVGVGDKVLFNRYGLHENKLEDGSLLISENDIIFIYDN